MVSCCIIFYPGMMSIVSNGNAFYLLPKMPRKKKKVNSYLGQNQAFPSPGDSADFWRAWLLVGAVGAVYVNGHDRRQKRNSNLPNICVCGVNTRPVTQSYPCIQPNNPINHSHIIHPSIFPFLTNPQPSSSLLIAVIACIHFPLSWQYEFGLMIPASLKKANY